MGASPQPHKQDWPFLAGALCCALVCGMVVLGLLALLNTPGLASSHAQAASPTAPAATTPAAASVERGRYLFQATGGCGCHTDRPNNGEFLAGGRALPTMHGTFYAGNLTPDKETGLGLWSQSDFMRAMGEGVSPDGRHYYPVFPYPAFSSMSAEDLADLWSYLRSVPAVHRANTPQHPAPWALWRGGLAVWKWLYFTPGAPQTGGLRPSPADADPVLSAQLTRGAYLVQAVAHCGQCHTQRNLLGGPSAGMEMAGWAQGPEGAAAPNITPDQETGIGAWSAQDLTWFLETGIKPDGDNAQGLMAELIEHGFAHLTAGDRGAVAAYLGRLPPVEHRLPPAKGR